MTARELSEIELERIGNTLPIPTKEDEVINELIKLGEKLETSESAAQRRRRLLLITARRHIGGDAPSAQEKNTNAEEVDEEFYSGASKQLIDFRTQVLATSKDASAERLEKETQQATVYQNFDLKELKQISATLMKQFTKFKKLGCNGTESGFSRPVSGVAFVRERLYAGDWSGKIFEVDLKSLAIQSSEQIHTGKVCLSGWRDGLISGGLEGNIKIGNLVCKGESRVASVDGHPNLDIVAGAYFDGTFKIWSANGDMLLSQTGHNKEVYNVKFHPDGALISSSGLDGLVRVWDLRSGKTVMVLDKHVKQVYSMDWCSDGHTLASGGSDNSLIVWDIRNKAQRMIPAHTSILSSLKFVGPTIVSGSYDKTVKFWNYKTGSLMCSKDVNEKVLSIDMNENSLVVGKWDRTIDIWGSP